MTEPRDSTHASSLVERLHAVYADGNITNIEYMTLRDEADQVFLTLIERFADNAALPEFQRLADELVQTMQLGIMDIKKSKPKPDAEAIKLLKDSFGFQVAYIKLCFDRFTQGMA